MMKERNGRQRCQEIKGWKETQEFQTVKAKIEKSGKSVQKDTHVFEVICSFNGTIMEIFWILM